MYVWMEVRRYVCINVTYCERGGAWLQVSLHLLLSLCVCLCVCELLGGGRQRERAMSLLACSCWSSFLAPCSVPVPVRSLVPVLGQGTGYLGTWPGPGWGPEMV